VLPNFLLCNKAKKLKKLPIYNRLESEYLKKSLSYKPKILGPVISAAKTVQCYTKVNNNTFVYSFSIRVKCARKHTYFSTKIEFFIKKNSKQNATMP